MIMGDLNTILYQTEKLRNGDHTQVDTRELQKFCHEAEVSDLTFSAIFLHGATSRRDPLLLTANLIECWLMRSGFTAFLNQ